MYQVVAKWAKLFLFYILHFKLSYSNTLSLKTVFGDTSKSMAESNYYQNVYKSIVELFTYFRFIFQDGGLWKNASGGHVTGTAETLARACVGHRR